MVAASEEEMNFGRAKGGGGGGGSALCSSLSLFLSKPAQLPSLCFYSHGRGREEGELVSSLERLARSLALVGWPAWEGDDLG